MSELLPSIASLLAEAATQPPMDPSASVEELRESADAGVLALHRFVRGATDGFAPGLTVTDLVVPGRGEAAAEGVPVRLYLPDGDVLDSADPSGGPLHIHLHGGGWWMGSIATVDPMCRELAVHLGMPVLSVDYRLAPEHPFPAGLEDVLAVVRWASSQPGELGPRGISSLTLGGESAGANLAAVAALRLRDEGDASLRGLWLDVPAVDLTVPATESVQAYGSGFGLEVAMLPLLGMWYLGGCVPSDPRISPQFADLSGLPPVVLTTAEFDPLRDQGAGFVEAIRDAGVEVWGSCHAGHIHGSSWLTALEGYDPEWYDDVINRVASMHA